MNEARGAYVRIFEFQAKPGHETEFEKIYGPEGGWAKLFQTSKGFIRTELYSDLETKGRYLTMDYFASESDYASFLEEARRDYDALDRRCESVRLSEKLIGSFMLCGK